MPDAVALAAIAQYFGADPRWLLLGEGVATRATPPERPGDDLLPLDEDERVVLESYRKLDRARQQMQLETIQALAKLAVKEARDAKKRRDNPGLRRRSA